MLVDGKDNFTPERFARLGIEPIVPGETFRLISPGTYISEEVAREILTIHPKRPQIWMRVKDSTEITLHSISIALAGALGGELALVSGVLFITALSVPRMVITGELPSLSLSGDTIATFGKLSAYFAGLGGLAGLAGGISEARNYPFNRFVRFS